MTQPRLSIIIPNHNYGHFFIRLGISLANQSMGLDQIELVLVDGNSTDDSRNQSIELENLPVRHFESIWLDHCSHPAQARNKGFAAARGEFIACLDPDDLPGPEFFVACLAALDRTPEASFAYSDYTHVENGEAQMVKTPEFDASLLKERNFLSPCVVMRRKVWEDSDGFRDNTLLDTWDFWMQAVANGHSGVRVDEPLFAHLMHGANRSLNTTVNAEQERTTLKRNNPSLFSS